MNSATKPYRTLVIMPALNEAERIGAVLRGVAAVLPDADIVVVNDGSSDGTRAAALAAGATVLSHATGMGYGVSLETAYFYAEEKGYDWILQMDSDGQHLPGELPRLLDPLLRGEADIVVGSRYAGGGGTFRTPLIKRVGQRFFGALLGGLTGIHFSDPTSGFQGLNRRAVHLFASGIFPCDYPDADVLLMAHRCGLRIVEAPVRMVARSGGVSMHAGLKPLYYAMKMSLSLFIVLLNHRHWKQWRGRLEQK